ncbi:MAG: hypothetical protein IPM57_12510 [Oligoflexia bacterium]|nr:hypothetical protein [Oligoflexia bacterium]
MHLIKQVLPLILLFLSFKVLASVEAGFGVTSATSGRLVPAVSAAVTWSDKWALTGFSTGVSTNAYYQSTYGLSFFRTWKAGEIIGIDVQSGFGLGTFFSKREFKNLSSGSAAEQKTDFGVGPALRMNLSFFKNFYLNMEATYGLRELGAHFTFNFQDMVSASLGFRL